MIVTLTFDKSSEDFSEQEMMDTILGPKYSLTIYKVQQAIRNRLKYEQLTPDKDETLEWVQQLIMDTAYDNGIILDQ